MFKLSNTQQYSKSLTLQLQPFTFRFFFLILLIKEISSQCCLKFNNGECIQCPSNTHLYLGNCLFNIPNCAQYSNGFECSSCQKGYLLLPSNKCQLIEIVEGVVPVNGYLILDSGSYRSSLIESIIIIITNKYGVFEGLKLIIGSMNSRSKTNKVSENPTEQIFFRLLFSMVNGFLEAIVYYRPSGTNAIESSNITIKSISIVQIEANQQFINLQSDLNYLSIEKLVLKQPPNTVLIDSFRSILNPTKRKTQLLKYRIFTFNPDFGLKNTTQIFPTKVLKTAKELDLNTIEPQLRQSFDSIIQSGGWTSYLQDASISKISQQVSIGFQTYEIRFRHNKTLTDGKQPESFFYFDINFQTGYIFVGERFVFGLTQIETKIIQPKSQSSKGPINQAENSTQPFALEVVQLIPTPPPLDNKKFIQTLTTISPQSNAQKQGSPTLQEISENITFIQQIDILKFISAPIFQEVRSFQQKYYRQDVISDLIKVAVADNTTNNFYQLVYRSYTPEQFLTFYTFKTSKQRNNSLQLLNFIKVPLVDRSNQIIGDSNRTSVIISANQTLKSITSILKLDRQFEEGSQIFQINTIKYKKFSSQLSIQRITFKYYYPVELKKSFEYIEFRFQVSNSEIRKLNKIIVPKQNFSPVESNNTILRDSILFYVIVKQIPSAFNSTNYTINTIFESLDRAGIYRLLIDVQNRYTLLYEIDTNDFIQPRIIANKSDEIPIIPLPTPIHFGDLNTSNTQVDLQTGQSLSPQSYNMQYMFENFPEKRQNVTQIDPKSSDSLTQDQVKNLVADFLNQSINSMNSIKIVNQTRSQNTLDQYTIEATKTRQGDFGLRRQSQKFQFSFQVARKQRSIASKVQNFSKTSPPYRNPQPNSLFLPLFGLLSATLSLQKTLISSLTEPIKVTTVQPKPTNILEYLFGKTFQKNATTKPKQQVEINNFLKKIPEITPVRYAEGISRLTNYEFSNPQKTSDRTLSFLEQALKSPYMYKRQLTTIQNQRSALNDPNIAMVNMKHVYYGNIRVWTSVVERKIPQIEYPEKGCLYETNDTGIMKQIPEIMWIQQSISNRVSKTLGYFGYNEENKRKRLSVEDIKYWRFRKINYLNEMQIYYELGGFLVRVKLYYHENRILDPNVIISDINIVNDNKRHNQIKTTQRRLRLSKEFRSAYMKLWMENGSLLRKGDIYNITLTQNKQNNTYKIIFLTPSSNLTIKLVYQKNKRSTIIQEVKNEPFLQLYIQGCSKPQIISQTVKCALCSPQYYMHLKDNTCYLKIKNCKFQNRELCLQCGDGYYLTQDYKCE